MSEIGCLYCGKQIPDNVPNCPHCGAVSHFQERGYQRGAKVRFYLLVAAVSIFCLVFMLWLPQID